jgi:hypothetical protein
MDALNTILQIPERCMVHKKITKAFFKRNFDLISGEKTLLDNLIAIDWLASISPASANIPVYKEGEIIFEEVEIISVQTSEADFEKNHLKIAELIQKYIPYPILVFIKNEKTFVLNVCDKKINQNDNTKRTIEKRYFSEIIGNANPTKQQDDFLKSLTFSNLDKTNLKTFYESYQQRMIALQASEINGSFIPRTKSRSLSDMDNLEKIEILNKEIVLLQNQIKNESQLNQRVELNIQIQKKRKEIENYELKIMNE